MSKRYKRAERRVARKLGTRRTPLSGSNSAHTASDTLHPELFVEVKLRKRPPLWDQLLKLRRRGRRVGRLPLIVADQVDSPLRLAVTGFDEFLVLGQDQDPALPDPVWDAFLIEHIATRRSSLFSLWRGVEAQAADEGKRPLVVYKASGRPGELVAWRPAWKGDGRSARTRGHGPTGGEGPRPREVKISDSQSGNVSEGTVVDHRVQPHPPRVVAGRASRRGPGRGNDLTPEASRGLGGDVHQPAREALLLLPPPRGGW